MVAKPVAARTDVSYSLAITINVNNVCVVLTFTKLQVTIGV